MVSARKSLALALKAAPSLPPKSYDVKEVADLPDTIRKATIIVERAGFGHAPNAGSLSAKFKVTVCRPETDIEKAEDALDQDVPNLLEALQKYLGATWDTTEPALVKSLYRGESVVVSFPIDRPF